MILLDTHVVVWLYQDPWALIPSEVRQRLQDEDIGLSPFVRLELHYLNEIGRLGLTAGEVVSYLAPRLEMTFTDPSAATVCSAALSLHWTRDPFDRLLAAQALTTSSVLVTKDRTIRQHLDCAWWPQAGQ